MVQLNELENTLWGIVLRGTERYEHKSERPIHISMASLDTSSESDDFVPVVVETSSTTKYIICTLSKPHVLQQPIELELNGGETVTFALNSKKGSVHLTGYYLVDSKMDEFDTDDEMAAANGGEHVHGPNCSHGHEDEDEDDDDDDDEEMDSEDDEDDDDEDGLLGAEDDEDDEDDDEEDDDDEDEDDDDEDEDEDEDDDDDEEEEEAAAGKRKLPAIEAAQAKKQKDDKAPKLVPNQQQQQQQKKQEPAKDTAQVKTLAGGVTIVDKAAGHGPEAKNGKVLSVYYRGSLKQNGKQFDALTSGKPFTFRLGRGDVIKGWDVGMQGMKVGGKRTITCPPAMGYGNRKSGPIPPNSTLVFEVELKAVN